jgi:hypothetical protein
MAYYKIGCHKVLIILSLRVVALLEPFAVFITCNKLQSNGFADLQ